MATFWSAPRLCKFIRNGEDAALLAKIRQEEEPEADAFEARQVEAGGVFDALLQKLQSVRQ